MCYIRDGINRYNHSFLAAGSDIADCGAEVHGLSHLAGLVWSVNRFSIAFFESIGDEEIEGCLGRILTRWREFHHNSITPRVGAGSSISVLELVHLYLRVGGLCL